MFFRLNPSYDNFSEWIAAGYDLAGVDLARARRHSLDRHNTQFATNVNQILREIHRHNISIQQESKQLAELSRIPKRPFGLNFNFILWLLSIYF